MSTAQTTMKTGMISMLMSFANTPANAGSAAIPTPAPAIWKPIASAALLAATLGKIATTPALPMLLFSRELNVENEALRITFRGRLAAFHALLMHEVRRG